MVRYVYNAWGEHAVLNPDGTENTTPSSIGNLNPLRYRGYYYDVETGLYHCQTRYYDPELGRWLNADDIENAMLQSRDINGLNLYAYCLNNPIAYSDPCGQFVLTAVLIGLIAGAIIGGTVGGVTFYNEAKSLGMSGWRLMGATALGFLGGAVLGGALGAGIGALAGVAIPAISTFMGTTFTLGSFAFGGQMVAISVTGTQMVMLPHF